MLNEWANKYGNGTGNLSWSGGYIYSKCVGENPSSMQDAYIHEGFTELSTTEEFFAKVGYTPEPVLTQTINNPNGVGVLNSEVKEKSFYIRYYPLFKHMNDSHGLLLLESEMQEIITIVNEIQSIK